MAAADTTWLFPLGGDEPPAGLSVLRQALWWDANGNWSVAHDLAAAIDSQPAACVHAYLHRKEGDAGNARYWYARAGISPYSGSLDQEWRMLLAKVP